MMKREEQKRLVEEQFALDYNCSVEDFQNTDTLVTEYKEQEGMRKFEEESLLSMLSYNGKIVITARPEILPWCQETLQKYISAEWGFEAGSVISIDKKLHEFGYQVDQSHIFFLPKQQMEAFDLSKSDVKVKILSAEEIPALEADERIDEAFLFDDEVKDMLGAAVMNAESEMLAVAGASENSDRMWEMGANSFVEGKGYGKMALIALIQEVQKLGKVPYSGTAMSHFASQKISLGAGMTPAFAELRSRKIGE